MSNNGVAHCDVAVVGGGLVGSALAAALASDARCRGLKVALIDPSPPVIESVPRVSLRTSTIAPSSKQFLDDIGVWSKVPSTRIAPFDDMFIWDTPSSLSSGSIAGALHFDARTNGNEQLGYVLDNDTLRHAMFRRLEEVGETEIVAHFIDSLDFTGSWPILQLRSGDRMCARLVVACDGARSRIRTLANMDWYTHAYELCAVVATVEIDTKCSTAYQRFLSTGPLAVLPMSHHIASAPPLANIVWTTTPVEARALIGATDERFVREVNIALHEEEEYTERYGNDATRARMKPNRADRAYRALPAFLRGSDAIMKSPPIATAVQGSRAHFPLHFGHAPRYIDENCRVVLAGDAAHNVHPLAGQGVNMGFADVKSLVNVIAEANVLGRDIGGENGAPLSTYQTQRILANMGMSALLGSVQRVFHVQSSPAFRDLRRLAMSTLNGAMPVKRAILRLMR